MKKARAIVPRESTEVKKTTRLVREPGTGKFVASPAAIGKAPTLPGVLKLVADSSRLAADQNRLIGLAVWVFDGNVKAATKFMDTPHPLLKGNPPAKSMKTQAGRAEIERILLAIEHGLPL